MSNKAYASEREEAHYEESLCPRCKCCEMYWEDCYQCGGKGCRASLKNDREDENLWAIKNQSPAFGALLTAFIKEMMNTYQREIDELEKEFNAL